MRKVNYTIDDKKYFEADLYRQKPNITAEEVEAIFVNCAEWFLLRKMSSNENIT